MEKALLRRFRREIRENEHIKPRTTVHLSNDPRRQASTAAAKLLLNAVFQDNITVETSPKGILCGCREEAAASKLRAYTTTQEPEPLPLLHSLTKQELETLLKANGSEHTEVWIPDSPELQMVTELGSAYPDVLYGL